LASNIFYVHFFGSVLMGLN